MNLKQPYADYLNNLWPQLEKTGSWDKSELRSCKKLGRNFRCIETGKFMRKCCNVECSVAKKCTRKCLEVKWKKEKESVTIKNSTTVESIVQLILKGIEPDTVVLVADRQYSCHAFVLTMNSAYFRKLIGHTSIDLRQTQVTANAFDFIYGWMLLSAKEIPRRELLDILRSVYFLEIPLLIHACLDALNGNEFREIDAFYIIYSLRNSTDLLHISQAMTPRISKSALTVMCSQQFLQLTIDQMCFILQSNFLTVNTECEILFCALHWLDVDWPSRSSHLPDVFKCIRFTFLSPKLLSQLTNSGYANIGRFRRVLAAFFKWPPSKQLIEDGIFYSSIVISLSCNRSSLEQFADVRKELLIPRRWMQDVRCSYHRPVTGQCPNMYYITYSEFVQYSRQLRETMDNYEVFIDHPEEIKGKPKDRALSDSMQCEPSTSNYIICDQLFCGASAENEQKFISLSKYFTPSKFWDLMF